MRYRTHLGLSGVFLAASGLCCAASLYAGAHGQPLMGLALVVAAGKGLVEGLGQFARSQCRP